MRVEVEQKIEQKEVLRPTTLQLFLYPKSQMENLRKRDSEVKRLYLEFKRAVGAYHSWSVEAEKRVERVSQTAGDLYKQFLELRSSITCSKVFLKMRDELSQLGLKSDEILDFFKPCIKTNTKSSEEIFKKTETPQGINQLKMSLLTQESQSPRQNAVERFSGHPPSWFSAGQREWKAFITSHSFFSQYLGSGDQSAFHGDPVNYQLGPTFKDGVPDWLEDLNNTNSDHSQILEEIQEDDEVIQTIMPEHKKLVEHEKYLVEEGKLKSWKLLRRIVKRTKEVFPVLTGFADLILFLDLFSESEEPILKPTEEYNPKVSTIEFMPAEKVREREIKKFTSSSQTFLCKEMIALYMENSLRKAGVIESAQMPVNSNLGQLFSLLFNTLSLNSAEAIERFNQFKVSNKKAFKSLNYDIKPLLGLLGLNQIDYLKELLTTSENLKIESLILEMAEAVEFNIKGATHDELERQQQVSVGHVRDFAERFLKANWHFVYDLLHHVLYHAQHARALPQTEAVGEITFEEVTEIETEINRVKEGNLSNWQLLYSTNRSKDDESLVLIEGLTLDEKENQLGQFITRQGISCSIKPASIIRAFDWLVTVPENIEWLRTKKEVDGNIFRKLKRGRVRILYDIDYEVKKIIFFIHQKKAWGYGF